MRLTPLLLLGALALAACGHRGPPPGAGGRGASPSQMESSAAVTCRLKPLAGADGSVTKDALDKALWSEFRAADRNGDGVLDKAEIAALNAGRASSCDPEPVIDWRGEGRMDYATFAARSYTLFQRADRDGDGIVNIEEIERAGRRDRKREMPPREGMGPG